MHYVYVIFRPNGAPCYVGMGSGDRWRRHAKRRQNPHLAAIFDQADGRLPIVKIRCDLTREQAAKIEIAMIAAIGREPLGPLVNLTDGGDGGTPGAIMSAEWRAERSRLAKEQWRDPVYRSKMLRPDRKRGGNSGPRSEEFKISVAAKMRGNQHTLGFRHSDDARERMSRSHRGVAKSPPHRAAIAAAHRARHLAGPQ